MSNTEELTDPGGDLHEDAGAEGIEYVRVLRNGQIVPDEAEIRAACAEIREGWSQSETLRRAGLDAPGWTVPRARASGMKGL